ncbi:MAG: FHA domain-containing protein [Gammaproteobacteria bacterium]|nr:MAG: FHA domain-containing protein [Gammaproteobacteria bacterium]
MAKVVLTLDERVLGEYPLNKECITIGRRPDNDIQIDNLAVSGQHCQIITILNDSFIEDLNSTNGTLVNDKPIRKHALVNGDVITIGKHQLKYINELATAAAPSDDFEKTMVIRPDQMGMPESEGGQKVDESVSRISAELSKSLQEAEAASQAPQKACLRILNGSNAGKELELTKALTTIGKPGTQVTAISRRPQGFFVMHVEGSAIPLLNGEPLGKHAQPLSDGDIIEVTGIKMEFSTR